MKRHPAVAGRLDPDDPAGMARAVRTLIGTPPSAPERAVAVVVPHAGCVDPGRAAGTTLAAESLARRVVLPGPNRTGEGEPVAVDLSEDVNGARGSVVGYAGIAST